VVVLGRADGKRVEPGRLGFLVAEAGTGHGQLEHLDHLGAQRAGELSIPADGGLAGDPALLVGGRAQRQVGGLVEQPVPGLDTVPGGQDVRGFARMWRSTRNAPRTRSPRQRPRPGRCRVGPRPRPGPGRRWRPSLDRQPRSGRRPPDGCLTVTSLTTWTSWRRSSSPSSRPSSRSTVGMTAGACSIKVTVRPRAVKASAISRPMWPPPTMTAERAPAVRAWWRAKVSAMVCSTCTPGRSRPSIGGRTGTAPVPMTSRS
jgi:hypothetical protein